MLPRETLNPLNLPTKPIRVTVIFEEPSSFFKCFKKYNQFKNFFPKVADEIAEISNKDLKCVFYSSKSHMLENCQNYFII